MAPARQRHPRDRPHADRRRIRLRDRRRRPIGKRRCPTGRLEDRRADAIGIALPALAPKSGGETIEITGPNGTASERLTLAGPPPPQDMVATVIARNVQHPPATSPVPITLGSDAEIPGDAVFTFSLHADKGARFTGRETVEVATDSGGATATLSASAGLRLADQHVMLATIEPSKALGTSAFGILRARILRDGVAGEWLTLGTLVRLPKLAKLDCPADPSARCALSGDDLFLIDSLSATPGFEQPIPVPDGYPGTTLEIPRPAAGRFYLRLRDDPAVVSRAGA